MKFLSLILVLAVLILVFACKKKDCKDVQIGNVDLNTTSLGFTPYEEGAQLVFQNEQNEKMTFTNQKVEEDFRLCIKDICTPLDPYKIKSCEYYAAQGIRNILRKEGDDLLVELVVSTESYGKPKDLKFYDFFSTNLSGNGIQTRGEYIASKHNIADSDFEMERTIMNKPMAEVASIDLLGKTYTNVIHTEESDHMVYFEKGKGLVVLKINGLLWALTE